MSPRLLITRTLPDTVMQQAAKHFDLTARDIPRPMTAQEARAALAEFDAVLPTLGDNFGTEVFDAPEPRCRILANFGVGYNHIDAEAAKARGMTVTNTPGAVTDATADTAMTLILMTARRAAEGERLVRSGKWEGWHPVQMLGQHVTGRTLGVVGMGRIGRAIAHRCHYGFGMKVIFFNRSTVPDPGMPAIQVATLAEAMAADIVVIATPGGAGTQHLIDAEALAAMPPHGILVNIARGEIVDETALIAALGDHKIAGAGLDVYEHEPKVPQALREMDQVTLLPHLGTAVLEVREDMGRMALANLIAFFEGKEVPNPV